MTITFEEAFNPNTSRSDVLDLMLEREEKLVKTIMNLILELDEKNTEPKFVEGYKRALFELVSRLELFNQLKYMAMEKKLEKEAK